MSDARQKNTVKEPATDDAREGGELLIWDAPSIISPHDGSTVPRRFEVKARGTTFSIPASHWHVDIRYRDRSGAFLQRRYKPSHFPVLILGVWYSEMTVTVEFPPDAEYIHWVRAEFFAIPAYSAWRYWEGLVLQTLAPPVITSPGTQWTSTPTIRGTGTSGLEVVLFHNQYPQVQAGRAEVKNGLWSFTPTSPWPMQDPYYLIAEQTRYGEYSRPSNPISFALLIKPVITGVSVTMAGVPTIVGAGGLGGAIIEILFEGGNGSVQMSTTVNANSTWEVTASRAWVANTYHIVARQRGRVTGALSDVSDAKTFSVLPGKPGFDNPGFVKTNRPFLSGTGLNGATIGVYQPGQSTPFATTNVVGGIWRVQLSKDLWSADPLVLEARQTLNAETSKSDPMSFTVLLPPEIFNVAVSSDGKPTFFGRGLEGAKIEIFLEGGVGGVQLSTDVKTGGQWSIAASSAWQVKTHNVRARQVGKNPLHQSDWSALTTFSVNPGVLTISPPQKPHLPWLVLTVTGVNPAATKLRMYALIAGGTRDIAGVFSGTGGTRQFTPTQPWALDYHVVKVVQSVGDLPSAPSESVLFMVAFGPPEIESPQMNAYLNIGDSFYGKSYTGNGVRIVVYPGSNYNEVASAIPDVDGNWVSTPLQMGPGKYDVRVFGEWNGLRSQYYGLRQFFVRPPQPIITPPSLPVSPRQALEIRTHVQGGSTRVFTDVGEVRGIISNVVGGSRLFTPSVDWPVGEGSVWTVARVQNVDSLPSEAVQFAVAPPAPLIHEPANQSHQPAEVRLSGSCLAGAIVYVLAADGNLLAEAQVTGNGWTAEYQAWQPGVTRVQAMQVVKGLNSPLSALREFFIKPYAPSISLPPSPAQPREVLTITRVFLGSVILKVLGEGEEEIAGTFSGSGTERSFTPSRDWPVGKNVIRAVQVVNAVTSDPSDAVIVCVQLLPLTIIAPSEPVEPLQALTLINVNAASTMLLMYRDGERLAGSFTRSETVWVFVPEKEWLPGDNTVWATEVINDAESLPSEPCRFKARPFTPQFDTPSQDGCYAADFEMSGGCYPGATVQVLNLDGSTLGSWPATGDRWRATYAWALPGFKQKRLLQVVNGVESHPSPVRGFYIALAAPVVVAPPSLAEAEQVLEINGVFSDDVIVCLYNNGVLVPGSFTASAPVRYFTPDQPWDHANRVTATQQLGDQLSTLSLPVDFIARPPVPHMIEPTEGGRYPHVIEVHGTGGVSEATVVLITLDGKPNASFPVGEGDSWGGRNRLPEPGFKQFQVIQRRHGIDSHPGPVRGFHIQPDPLVIVAPPSPATISQNLTVTGVYSGNVKLTMWWAVGGQVSGSFLVGGSMRMFRPLMPWPTAEVRVYAVQEVNGVVSEPSEICVFNPVIPAPNIEHPRADQTVDVGVRLSGSGDYAAQGSYIRVYVAATGFQMRPISPLQDGSWSSEYEFSDVPGFHEILLRAHNRESFSAPTYRAFRIRPQQLRITVPSVPVSLRQPIDLKSVYSPAATLQLFDREGYQLAGEYVMRDQNDAVFTPEQDWPYGENRISASQVVGGVESLRSLECVFTVTKETVPDAPRFELPLEGSLSASRPVVAVVGLPGAVMGIRLAESSEYLHVQVADGNGRLEFTLSTALQPGWVDLQVRQQHDTGPQSPWSEPHGFTVQPQPRTPTIDLPTSGSRVARKPLITGTAFATRGDLLLRHVDDLSNLLATTPAVRAWRWSASEPWALGKHGVQALHMVGGDSSEWSPVRDFEVVEVQNVFDRAGPVLSQPVVSNHEGAVLRVQVVSSATGEGLAGRQVRWIEDESGAMSSFTVTDSDGWAENVFFPSRAGAHQLLADITAENEGVITCVGFTVIALDRNEWHQHFDLYLNDRPVDLAHGALQLRRGLDYQLRLEVKTGSVLIGSTVTLQDLADAETLGVTFAPLEPVIVTSGGLSWSITSTLGGQGYFGLKLASPALADWHLPCKLNSDNLADLVHVKLDAFAGRAFGDVLYVCRGAVHTLTLIPLNNELIGEMVSMKWSVNPTQTGVKLSPDSGIERLMTEKGITWTLDCENSEADEVLALEMKVVALGITSRPLPLSLAHNKGVVSERFGPAEMGGTATYFRYGVRVSSAFTGVALPHFPVTMTKNRQVYELKTDTKGWVYVTYYLEDVVSLNLVNLYDMQSIERSAQADWSNTVNEKTRSKKKPRNQRR